MEILDDVNDHGKDRVVVARVVLGVLSPGMMSNCAISTPVRRMVLEQAESYDAIRDAAPMRYRAVNIAALVWMATAWPTACGRLTRRLVDGVGLLPTEAQLAKLMNEPLPKQGGQEVRSIRVLRMARGIELIILDEKLNEKTIVLPDRERFVTRITNRMAEEAE